MLSKLQLTNQGGEDDWGDFVSSPNKYGGSNDHAVSSGNSTRKIENGGGFKEDGIGDWDVFVSSSVGNGTNNPYVSTEILGKKLENGGLKIGSTSTHKDQDWSFFFSSSASPQLNNNATNFTSVKPAIPSEISNQEIENGILKVGPTDSDNWASFTTHQISNGNLVNGGLQLKKQEQLVEEEDDVWGTFISSPIASTNGTKPTIFNEISQEKLQNVKVHMDPSQKRDGYFEDDEWGDFISSPVASGTINGTSSTYGVKWEKPKGPLPLSFFGGEEDEESVEEEDEMKIESLQNSKSELIFRDFNSDSKGLELSEMIVNLYGGGSDLTDSSSSKITGNGLDQEDNIASPSNVTKQEVVQELIFDQGPAFLKESIPIPQKDEGRFEKNTNEENGVDEEIWEFKDAFLDHNNSTKTQETNLDKWASFASSNEKPIVSSSEMKSVLETDQSGRAGTSGMSESTMKNFVLEFYRKLREGSMFLISRHFKGLKEASKVAAFSGQVDKMKKINEKIQETYRELERLKLSKDVNIEDSSSKDSCINDLLNSIENSHLKAFEEEYQLSTKLFLALEELSPAIDLLKHSLITLNALEIASMDDINAYVSTWSRIISVCAQELQNGAIIWAESLKENLSDNLISIGGNYFTALGEIYRLVEILKITLKYFNSWLAFSNQNDSNEIGTSLEICIKSWESGLDSALDRVLNRDSKYLAKFIKIIAQMDFDEKFFENQEDYKEDLFCKICLIPLASVSGMRVVSWNGDKYFVKFANLWANKISSNPPNLPSIRLG